MNYPIRTNKLIFDVSYDKIEELYDFYCVRTSEKRFSHSAAVLDMGDEQKNICALRYEKGNVFYVMLYKSADNYDRIKAAVSRYDNAANISFCCMVARDLESYFLLQLLLNSLSWTDNKFLSFNNLTGKLYCFDANHIIHKRESEQDIVKQIISLEVTVDRTLCIQLNVRTFTNVKFKDKLQFYKRKFEEYPQYVISNKNTLKRKTKFDETKDTFILRQFNNKKAEIPFMSISDLKSFKTSKMGILTSILALFAKKYNEVATIRFDIMEEYKSIDHKKREDKAYKTRAAEIIKSLGVRIIDKVNTPSSALLISQIQYAFERMYGIQVPVRKNIAKTGLNIAVIHNKDWYDEKNDQHITTSDYSIQHITLEDFFGKGDFAVNTIVNELIVKSDLLGKQLTIFDWNSMNYSHDWVFGMKEEIDEESRYFFMTIHPDGLFDFSEKKLDLFSIDEYNKYSLILEDKNVKGVVVNNEGMINVIKDTGLFTIPEIEQIQEHLIAGDNKLRSKLKKDELLTACLDIKYMPESKRSAYYFVGTVGNGMQARISDACLIRKIEANEDSNLFFNEMLPLMNITFVRNGQLTVVPFPFKFLREWISMHVGSTK